MGRKLMRVPLSFDWPIRKVWKGYLNPYFKRCPKTTTNECHNGATCAGRWLDAISRFIALMGVDAMSEPHAEELRARGACHPHPYFESFAQAPLTDVPPDELDRIHAIGDHGERRKALAEAYAKLGMRRPLPFTEEMVQLVAGLSDREAPTPFGSNGFLIYRTLIRAAGVGEGWGTCRFCEGSGIDPAVREAHDAWKEEEPPEGPGYQVWETVTEGSPISPVFPTEDACVTWLMKNGYSEKASRNFVRDGFAMSGAIVDGRVYNDIESATLHDKK